MEKFQIIENNASSCFESYGFSFQEALENSCLALSTFFVSDLEQLNCHETLNLDAFGSNLEEITEMILSDLIYTLNEKDLVIKEAKTQEFGNNLSGGFFVKLIGHAGLLEQTENSHSTQLQIIINPGSITKNEAGIWKISVNLNVPVNSEETAIVSTL